MKEQNKITGNFGENLARDFLKSKKYTILETNYKNKFGEIDIIALQNETLVFVEVKTRQNREFGNPQEAVDTIKQNKIFQVSQVYLYEKKIENLNYRYDIIEIIFSEKLIHHIRNAFTIEEF